jgi:hypothetical protein
VTTRACTVLALLSLLTAPLHGQYRGPRSADYLLPPMVWGARALWVDPSGLGAIREASLMAEAGLERDTAGTFSLAQYTAGFSSRGFSIGLRHDRFTNGRSGNTWRFGLGRAGRGIGVGAALSLYTGAEAPQDTSGNGRRLDVDLGLRLRLAPSLELTAGVEHIGQPTVRDSSLRFGGAVGLGWTGLGGIVQLAADARASNPTDSASILMAYQAGLRIQTRGTLPLGLVAVLDIDKHFTISRLVAGLSVGIPYQAVLVGSGAKRAGETHVESVSLAGIVSKTF